MWEEVLAEKIESSECIGYKDSKELGEHLFNKCPKLCTILSHLVAKLDVGDAEPVHGVTMR